MSETREGSDRAGKAAEAAWASARVEDELLIVSLGGPWVTKHIGPKQARLARIGARRSAASSWPRHR